MKKIKQIFQSKLFKITSLNSVGVFIKIAIGLVTSKLLAVFVGPSGMALVGNFRNFISTLESVSTLGFQTGIVKYIAENQENKPKIAKIVSTVFISLLLVSVILSSGLFVFATFWNHQIFGYHNNFTLVFKILTLVLPCYATSIFLLSVINGLGQFKKVIYINIIGNTIGFLVSIILIVKFQTMGALLSIVIAPSLLFFATFYYINQEIDFFKAIRLDNFDFKIIKNLSSYSLMALVCSVIGPIIFIAIRNNVIETVGVQQAGFWETITRISSYYLMFATSIISIYFLPKLAVAKNNQETKIIFWDFYKSLVPIFIVGLIMVYFLRFFITKTLFTAEFLPVTNLFFYQLIGDLLKISSWILAFNLLAKKHTFAYILTELFSLFLIYVFSIYLVQIFGIEGIVMAHALSYLIYLIVLSVYFRKSLF